MIGNPAAGHTIVCGMGHLGRRIVDLLDRLGHRLVIIAPASPDASELASTPGVSFVRGDARDDRLLRDAGIAEARAVIIVTDDDLANVSIALDARRLNPNAAIIVRLFDQELGAHLEKSAQITRALSSSALAAPVFVAAAMGAHVRGSFELGDTVGLIEEVDATSAPPPDGQAVIVRSHDGALRPPERSTRLRLVDKTSTRKSTPRSSHLLAGLREWWRDVPASVRVALAALAGVVVFSVVLFQLTMGLSPVDAFYFVITTITTVGYGDYNFMNAPAALKLYGAFLMLCGAALLATLFSLVTDAILGARFRDVLARGCAEMKGHVIVAGLGSIGYRLVRELVKSGETVVAIEQQEQGDFVRAARELSPVILGNARTAETLRRAGLAGARALIAATDNDLVNLGAALAAKRARNDCRVVVRVFDSDLAEKMQHSLGVDAVRSASAAAAPTFVGCALCPEALQGVVLDDGLVLVFHRPAGSASERPDENESILFVRRAGQRHFERPSPGIAPAPGDEVIGTCWHPFPKGWAGA